MKHYMAGGLAAALVAAGMIAAAPPASAGCQYGGPIISKCDGPIQPDGTWERCVVTKNLVANGASSFFVPERTCNVIGPGGLDPHIDG
ncbi:hypothetical protein AWC05_09770 [Mycobacterium florentinum]|uniref:CDGP domain-containing protein n=1 Tax=Mycobacterium florentinum TaxID=292462 RepID=A0A1X1UI32_MYCFL|nr:hypothetical protein [Mycobacterium florentinum]MCV7409318.1 hypothetical protein [Mycobacterium florentinum]ORV56496.1 hypothetical protein AWC05_09770 [Mycobacterium florentinum]BBX78486.1 hypothetical protein MFLOJ_22730 [Mycobacterium florentinum]